MVELIVELAYGDRHTDRQTDSQRDRRKTDGQIEKEFYINLLKIGRLIPVRLSIINIRAYI